MAATYYVQICDGVHRLPQQRVAQQKINDPANYFFNFDLAEKQGATVSDEFAEAYKRAGVVDTVKVVHAPKARNLVHVRLENLADLYDENSKEYSINLSGIADALWKSANKLAPVAYDGLEITELSLTGNMELKEMQARKLKWMTVDDEKMELPRSVVDYEFTPDLVKVEPQRIRVFALEFSPASETPSFLN